LSVLYPGKNPQDLHLNPNEVHVLQRLTHFDQVEIEDLFEQFKSLANSRGGIDKQTFEHCLGPLGVARNLITERLFAFFDQDSNGRIDFSELVCGLSVLCKGTSEEKIKYAFRGYDLDSDGYITQEELFKMFKAYFYLSKEAIKDAIKTVELDALGNFDESGTDPVSAAFAQIQSAHQQHGASNSAAINSSSDTATSNALPAVGSERQVNNVNTPQSDDAENSNANEDSTTINGNAEQSSLNSSAELPEDTESRDDSAVTDHQQQSDTSINGNEARDLPGPSAQRTSLQKIDLSASVDLTDYLKPNSPRTEVAPNMEGESEEVDDMSRDVSTADMNDVLEKLYQKAIEDMASRAFHAADVNKDGKISFEEFKAWAEKDPTMTLWLEALGSIF
jgi:Ca2+-binding EF-hand superfamily protein